MTTQMASTIDFIKHKSKGKTFIIAEIGTSHNGDLSKAQELIQAAKESGADCAKFQIFYADEILHPLTGQVVLPGGKVPLYQRFLELEKDQHFYNKLKELTEDIGLTFLASVFGSKSVELAACIGMNFLKIASPELNHYPLLKLVARMNKAVILSTGVSTLGDIEKALSFFSSPPILLHCVTSYPAPETDYNLNILKAMRMIFGCPVGVSDHSNDPVLVPLLSVLCGGVCIEKHFTLSRKTRGLDDPIALTPESFKRMSMTIRKYEDRPFDIGMEYLMTLFPKTHIDKVLGNGRKFLSPSEAQTYETTNRSIISIKNINQGDHFTTNNISILRSEKKITPGLSPEFFKLILGKKSVRHVPNGRGIVWQDLLYK